jgi:hypothetical protein
LSLSSGLFTYIPSPIYRRDLLLLPPSMFHRLHAAEWVWPVYRCVSSPPVLPTHVHTHTHTHTPHRELEHDWMYIYMYIYIYIYASHFRKIGWICERGVCNGFFFPFFFTSSLFFHFFPPTWAASHAFVRVCMVCACVTTATVLRTLLLLCCYYHFCVTRVPNLLLNSDSDRCKYIALSSPR